MQCLRIGIALARVRYNLFYVEICRLSREVVDEMGKLALGTVQFGIPYGIANNSGKVSSDEVSKILEIAKHHGVDTLDTAIAYGDSEKVLGAQDLSGFLVITKLSELSEQCNDIGKWVRSEIAGSLERLNIDVLDGVLLHRPLQLLEPYGAELYRQLVELKKAGLVKRIGISVYGPDELTTLCETYHFDIVQAPFNVLDRRLMHSGWLQRLHSNGTAVHIRSVFMQGLLLMSADKRPNYFSQWDELWKAWGQWLLEHQLSPVEACLRYVMGIEEIEKVIVGIDSHAQLQQILKASEGECPELPEDFFTESVQLLNPSNWSVS